MSESVRRLCDFNREVSPFIGTVGCDGVIGGRDCTEILWIYSMKSGIFEMFLGWRWRD